MNLILEAVLVPSFIVNAVNLPPAAYAVPEPAAQFPTVEKVEIFAWLYLLALEVPIPSTVISVEEAYLPVEAEYFTIP
ncbi:MAG: hypothetical protein IJ915_04855 [Paludibacteraceae bacterium]|nr:hypothetical protein [Paludibacteraceae bacterium]